MKKVIELDTVSISNLYYNNLFIGVIDKLSRKKGIVVFHHMSYIIKTIICLSGSASNGWSHLDGSDIKIPSCFAEIDAQFEIYHFNNRKELLSWALENCEN